MWYAPSEYWCAVGPSVVPKHRRLQDPTRRQGKEGMQRDGTDDDGTGTWHFRSGSTMKSRKPERLRLWTAPCADAGVSPLLSLAPVPRRWRGSPWPLRCLPAPRSWPRTSQTPRIRSGAACRGRGLETTAATARFGSGRNPALPAHPTVKPIPSDPPRNHARCRRAQPHLTFQHRILARASISLASLPAPYDKASPCIVPAFSDNLPITSQKDHDDESDVCNTNRITIYTRRVRPLQALPAGSRSENGDYRTGTR